MGKGWGVGVGRLKREGWGLYMFPTPKEGAYKRLY